MQQRRPLPRWLLVALGSSVAMLILAGVALASLYRQPPAGFGPMPAFTLTNQERQSIASEQLNGKVLIFSFIFTNCTDICPIITTQMRELQERLAAGGLARDTQLISISVDPERDTPEALAAYAAIYGAETDNWHFLTGEPEQIKQVVTDGFLLALQKGPSRPDHSGHGAHDYDVNHSDRIILVDRKGQIRSYHSSHDLDLGRLLGEIQALR